jgi:quercetin dioxygenase-like cupin family protein
MLGARKFANLSDLIRRSTGSIASFGQGCNTLPNHLRRRPTRIERPIIENPLYGERIRFLKTVPETNGEMVQYESWMAPGGHVGVPHVHPIQESRFQVISGQASFRVGGQDFVLAAGQALSVPARTPHYLWNSGDTDAHLVIEFRPGLLKQEFFETTFGLARERRHLSGLSRILQLAVLTAAYRSETRPLHQPAMVRLGLLALAPLAWLLGFRAHYDRYCTRREGSLPDTDEMAG